MKFFTFIITMLASIAVFGLTDDEVKRWTEDVDVYSRELIHHHIDPFHTISRDAFDAEIARIKQSLPQKSTNQVLVDLMALTHSINDGHTSFPLWNRVLNHFPLELKMLGRELYVVKTTAEHKTLLGAKLIAINGRPALAVMDQFSNITPFSENSFSTAVRVAEYIPKAEVLNGLGIIASDGGATFAFEQSGQQKEYRFSATRSTSLDAELRLKNTVFSPIESISADLWFGASAENKAVYVYFHRYTTLAKMEKFSERLLAFIQKNNTKNLIIDLRDNYGGDFFVGLKLAQLLVLADSINWKSGVYVLIDNVTFSAAMSNAAQFSQILNAQLVGSPTGAKPSGYQDMGQFILPNSKLEVTYSKRLYHFKEDQREALYPDVTVELSIEDYKNNNDKVLNWVLKDIYTKSTAD